MRHHYLVSTLVLIVLFSLVFSLGFYFGASYKNNKYYNEGFSAGFNNALTSLAQNNVIPSPTETTTANAILKQKKEDQLIVEILPSAAMPIINPQEKTKTINLTENTEFCKIVTKPMEQAFTQSQKGEAPILSEKQAAKLNEFEADAKIQITTINNILTNNSLVAKEICLYE